jgi:hypothetical protein
LAVGECLAETSAPAARIALVGPRGQGKIALAAALAGRWREKLSKETLIILAGAESATELRCALRALDHDDLPIVAAPTAEGVGEMLASRRDQERTLIVVSPWLDEPSDSASSTAELLAAAAPHQTMLALSAALHPRVFQRQLDGAERLGLQMMVDGLTLTRLSHAPMLGHLVQPLVAWKKPVFYTSQSESMESLSPLNVEWLAHELLRDL